MALLSLTGPLLTTLVPLFYTAVAVTHLTSEGFVYNPATEAYEIVTVYVTNTVKINFLLNRIYVIIVPTAGGPTVYESTNIIFNSDTFETMYNNLVTEVRDYQI